MSRKIGLERDLEESLCDYPELIDDTLFGIRQGMEALGDDFPTLKRQDPMPNGRRADLVFVEHSRVTVIEIKKGRIAVGIDGESEWDAIDQISDYLRQSRLKYPSRREYRGFIVGTEIVDRGKVEAKIRTSGEVIIPLVLGRDIPSTVKICSSCNRAVGFFDPSCLCGERFP